MCDLLQKYNVPGPRYTSYPTVPFWDVTRFSGRQWGHDLKATFDQDRDGGISLYIHLPFCESMCTFCGCHKRITKRHEVESPYIDAVLKEWQLYVAIFGERPWIKNVHLGGGTPTFFAPANLVRLIDGLFRIARRHPDLEMSFEGHPNNTTKAHLEALYSVGFRSVCFGVQDYNPNVQRAINRIQPFEHVEQVTNWARAIGYTSVGHDIIYGLPKQTTEDVVRTVAMTERIRPDRLAFYSYAHVPWRKGNGQRGYSDEDLPSASEKQMQYRTGKSHLMAKGYEEIGMDHYALQQDALYQTARAGKLHRNFMGYTATKTKLLIGLGASSISDCWTAFAQNVKGIEAYQELVAQGILPVVKGHHLTVEDQRIRRCILDIMCRFETELPLAQFSADTLAIIRGHLMVLQQDGLVHCSGDLIKVTEKGKPFVRNVAMAFDIRWEGNRTETRLFSMTV